jgi:hypothetical protein
VRESPISDANRASEGKERDAMTYRRRKEVYDAWHWCHNCTRYPTDDFIEVTLRDPPTRGELCDQCQERERGKNCSK